MTGTVSWSYRVPGDGVTPSGAVRAVTADVTHAGALVFKNGFGSTVLAVAPGQWVDVWAEER